MRSLNSLTLHYLQAFVLSAELGGISAAARALGKRQSQVSSWVQDLELELGVSLFIRSGNALQLSAAGVALLPLAQHTLAQSSRLQAAANALVQHNSVQLRIGVALHVPAVLLRDAIVAFMQQQPDVQLHLSYHSEAELSDGLHAERFDMVVLHESVELHNSRYDYCRVGHYDEVMVVRANHPLAHATDVSVADLAAYRELVCAAPPPAPHAVQDFAPASEPACVDESGYSGRFSLINDFYTLRSVLLQTDCIAVLPAVLLQPDLQQGRLVPLQLAEERSVMRRRLELRWPLGYQYNHLVASWLALVKQALASTASGESAGV